MRRHSATSSTSAGQKAIGRGWGARSAWERQLSTISRHCVGMAGRPYTAPIVQDSGVVGGPFTVVSATIAIALLEWTWGRALAAGAWLAGGWGLCAALGRVVGYHVSAGDVAAYRARSSGATYLAAATLSAALVIRGTGRRRLLGLAGPAIAATLWVTANDGHGVVFVEGVRRRPRAVGGFRRSR